MGTFIACYIEAGPSLTGLLPDIKKVFRRGKFQPHPQFLFIELNAVDQSPPEEQLQNLSERGRMDIFWLAFQSSSDVFYYLHWHRGKLVRALGYGYLEEERTWERIEGAVEPWERAAIFSNSALEHAIEFASSEQEKEELQNLWAAGNPVEGQFNPQIDARETARAVAEHFRLPGWS